MLNSHSQHSTVSLSHAVVVSTDENAIYLRKQGMLWFSLAAKHSLWPQLFVLSPCLPVVTLPLWHAHIALHVTAQLHVTVARAIIALCGAAICAHGQLPALAH